MLCFFVDKISVLQMIGFYSPDRNFRWSIVSINGKELETELPSPVQYRRNGGPMRKTRAMSVCGGAPAGPLAGTETAHRLRSRRPVRYVSPPPLEEDSSPSEKGELRPRRRNHCTATYLEEDSLSDSTPDREHTETRASSRLLAKMVDHENEEVWDSGRPKRSCNRPKRASADERLVVDNKSYYKVEVLSGKLRSSSCKDNEDNKRKSHSSSASDQKEEEKSLIVKFKKLRNSELIRLNNEAENFLFPKKEDSSSENETEDDNATSTTFSTEKNETASVISEIESAKSSKFEDEVSLDSTCSEIKRKKKRRTHAEAFIMDNQKYYKFETPGSRLRYQGNILPAPVPKNNGECTIKSEKQERREESHRCELDLNKIKFSFEITPRNESWYETFQRQDKGEEKYVHFSDEAFWNPFLLPYQTGPLPPLDPKICVSHYHHVKKYLMDPPSSSSASGSGSTPNHSSLSNCELEDEDTKNSTSTINEPFTSTELSFITEGGEIREIKRRKRKSRLLLDKNPRKSPRQHASTLAILSSLLHQRKRKSRSPNKAALSPIAEESQQTETAGETSVVVKTEPIEKKTPNRRVKINYQAILQSINEEMSSLSGDLDDVQFDAVATGQDSQENERMIFRSKTNALDVLNLYEECRAREDSRGSQRFFGATPGRKPGRKKKTNRTGWPNRIRRLLVKKGNGGPLRDDPEDSNVDSGSINSEENSLGGCDEGPGEAQEAQREPEKVCKEPTATVLNTTALQQRQPYVRVQKLGGEEIRRRASGGYIQEDSPMPSPKRTPKGTRRKRRRMPASPKSPRMLRRPRGRWYKER